MIKYNYRQSIIVFDIETTSYVEWDYKIKRDGSRKKYAKNKFAWMYAGAFNMNGVITHVRTWEGVKEYLDSLCRILGKNERYIIWVHNLSFEFQFMKDFLELHDVFCRKAHNVLKCVYRDKIEFRCSYTLANCKLEKLAENEKLPVKKLVGDLDYDLIRHSSTPINRTEWGYIDNDVLIPMYYIQKKLVEYKRLENIPLTSTGEVRYLFVSELGKDLKKIHNLAVLYSAQTMELQNLLIDIYAGAYTHCNYQCIGSIVHHLKCRDIASSYPFQMACKKFPTIWFKMKTQFSLLELMELYNPEKYAWACYLELTDLKAKHCHNIISHHKAIQISDDCEQDNGRIVSASYIKLAVNEVDIANILDFYDFDIRTMKISNLHVSKKEYLPVELVKVILKLFQQKTSLKDIESEVENYMRSKNRINGVYGTSVFNVLNSNVYFDEESNTQFLKSEKTFADFRRHVNNPKNYLWYSIGVWVTSYARRQILTPIKKMSENAVYCDTDSVKYKNSCHRYDKLWEKLNNNIKKEFEDAMIYHKLPPIEWKFFDKYGKEHFMGIFEEEKPYRRFKSLGSKRYLVEYYDGKMSSTVAGAPKTMVNELGSTNDEKFMNFTNNFSLKNCKLTHTYTEGQNYRIIEDYLGNYEFIDIRSGVCLTKADFSMKLSDTFFEFLLGKIDFEDKSIYDYFFEKNHYEKENKLF